MDNQAPQSTVLGGTIHEWLANEALHDPLGEHPLRGFETPMPILTMMT